MTMRVGAAGASASGVVERRGGGCSCAASAAAATSSAMRFGSTGASASEEIERREEDCCWAASAAAAASSAAAICAAFSRFLCRLIEVGKCFPLLKGKRRLRPRAFCRKASSQRLASVKQTRWRYVLLEVGPPPPPCSWPYLRLRQPCQER